MTGGHLSFSKVSVTAGEKTILGPLTLELPLQGITAIIGPNGSGKSTLLRLIHGLETTSEGLVSLSDTLSVQSMVFQTPIMLRRSVAENLSYPLKITDVGAPEVAAKVRLAAENAGLNDLMNTYAPHLSGGEKQKLALARAVVSGPDFLLLDEPCANLDTGTTRQIEDQLMGEKNSETTILIATHDLPQARRLADYVVFLHEGEILEHGPAPEFWQQPKNGKAAAFARGELI